MLFLANAASTIPQVFATTEPIAENVIDTNLLVYGTANAGIVYGSVFPNKLSAHHRARWSALITTPLSTHV